MLSDKYFLITIDVEDWFQVENFKPWIPFSSWDSCELRVEKNVHRLLDLFDTIELGNPKRSMSLRNSIQSNNQYPASSNPHPASSNPHTASSIKATFFILAWIAESLPHLVREIHARGHEVASHGMNHHLCNKLAKKDLNNDLSDSKKLLEDIIGHQVYGFRAPSFAITDDILKAIQDHGYLYDSSYNSFSLHGRYGQMDFSQNEKKGIAIGIPKTQYPKPSTQNSASSDPHPASGIFYELPVSNLKFGNRSFPLGGGAYFRLLPFILLKTGVRKILNKENAFVFYLHPWEIDPMQPKVEDAFLTFKFRHYVNLKKTYSKLSKMIETFQHCEFVTCSRYLNSQI